MLDATLSGRTTLQPVTPAYTTARRAGYAHAHDVLESYVESYIGGAGDNREHFEVAIRALHGALAAVRAGHLMSDLIGGVQGGDVDPNEYEQQLRALADAQTCPDCGAKPGEPCGCGGCS